MGLRIIATGGTIDKIYFDAKSEFEVGEPLIDKILHDASVAFDFEVVKLMRKDSLEIDDEDREIIRNAVLGCEDRQILITHGTDTMTDTARALGDVGDKTVVLTGALSPARFQSSDATFNVGLAVGAVQSKEPGVYIAMNGCVFDSGAVRKDRELNRFVAIEQ